MNSRVRSVFLESSGTIVSARHLSGPLWSRSHTFQLYINCNRQSRRREECAGSAQVWTTIEQTDLIAALSIDFAGLSG